MTTLLIDGDVVAYTAAASEHTVIDWGDGESVHSDLEAMKQKVDSALSSYMKQLGGTKMTVAFSHTGDTFRHTIWSDYKAHRRNPKPPNYWELVAYIEDVYRCERWEHLEADDVLGLLATAPKSGDTIIVSVDKDMRTLVGKWANIRKDCEVEEIDQFHADYHWMTQALTGDTADGYKGLPGIGPKKAEKILEGCRDVDEMWDAVLGAFLHKGLTYDDALTQAQLARILRHGDLQKDGNVTLWTPQLLSN